MPQGHGQEGWRAASQRTPHCSATFPDVVVSCWRPWQRPWQRTCPVRSRRPWGWIHCSGRRRRCGSAMCCPSPTSRTTLRTRTRFRCTCIGGVPFIAFRSSVCPIHPPFECSRAQQRQERRSVLRGCHDIEFSALVMGGQALKPCMYCNQRPRGAIGPLGCSIVYLLYILIYIYI